MTKIFSGTQKLDEMFSIVNPFIVGVVSPYGTKKNDHNSKSNDVFQIILTDS